MKISDLRTKIEDYLNDPRVPEDLNTYGFGVGSRDFDPVVIRQLLDCIPDEICQTSKLDDRKDSYYLKHHFEKVLGKYVKNGEIILALILSGFGYRVEKINCYFNFKFLKEKKA